MTTLVAEANRLDEDVEAGRHVLCRLDKTGDTRIIWSIDNEDEVANARRTFDEMTKKGFRAYSVTRKGEKDKQIREFDPEAEKIILAPALVGG